MSTNNRGTAVIITMVLKQQISPTLENTYPPQTPIEPDTICIPDDNRRHASQTDACPVGLTLGEVECRAEGSAAFRWYYLNWRGGADVANVPHEEPSPNKHPLGRPPPAYKMMTVDMHRTRMHVLWGWRWGRWSVGRKAADIVRVDVVVLMWRTSLMMSHPPRNTHWAGPHLHTRWWP